MAVNTQSESTTTSELPAVNTIKKRINWLDVSRGLAFLMVIYSHLELCDSAIMRYLSPVFLTTFFFVSGYLFKENCSFKKVFEQRTRTLLLPFLMLGTIMILMSQILTFNERVPIKDEFKGLLFQNGENQLLWFIAALYIYSVIFYWIERWTKTPKVLIITSLILFVLNAVYFNITGGGFGIPWHIESFGSACFYMGLGKYFKENETILTKYVDRWATALICSVFYIALITIFDLHVSFGGGI